MKDRLRRDEYIAETLMNSKKMHISTWTRFVATSKQAALYMDPSYEKNVEVFKNSEFENFFGLFGITIMMIEGNSETKNVFLRNVASSLSEEYRIASKTSNKVDESKSICVLGLRVMLGRSLRSRRCSKKVD